MSRVLIVDDEEGICWALQNLLGDIGLEATSVATAEKGLEQVRSTPPDLVLLDVRLPGMDGLAALEILRQEAPELPVVLMTAHGTVDTATRFGLVDLLASFALFDDDPTRINRITEGFQQVTPELIRQTAQEYLRPGNRTVLEVRLADEDGATPEGEE